MNDQKIKLIDEIKTLISSNNKKIEFNIKYIEYFELDELQEIKSTLENKKEQNKMPSKDLINDIFNTCSK
jgi:hypothetical protein